MRHPRLFSYLLVAAVTLAAATSCDDDELGYILAPGSTSASSSATSFTPAAVRARLEVPQLLAGNELVYHPVKLGADSVLNFCVEYDPRLHHSRWVAFRFDKALAAKSVGRKDYSIRPQYPADPDCASSLPDDVSFEGFDHGHLCASADRLCCTEANWQTFYMTNMSPQYSRFNQDYWTSYESYVQGLGRQADFADTLYVVKGGTILPAQTLQYIHPGGMQMPVPAYYFIAMLKVRNGAYSALGLWVPHEASPRGSGSLTDIRQHAISIDELEELTGINFFHNLPDFVEGAVESICMPGAWGL